MTVTEELNQDIEELRHQMNIFEKALKSIADKLTVENMENAVSVLTDAVEHGRDILERTQKDQALSQELVVVRNIICTYYRRILQVASKCITDTSSITFSFIFHAFLMVYDLNEIQCEITDELKSIQKGIYRSSLNFFISDASPFSEEERILFANAIVEGKIKIG